MVNQAVFQTEEILVIETPERVPIHFALASIGNRFLACAIDHFIQIAAIILLFVVLNILYEATDVGGFFGEMPRWIVAIAFLGVFLISQLYFVLLEWRWNGQTFGKRFLKLRVIREDGRPVTLWEAATRNLLRIVDMFPTFPFYSVGLISVFLSERDQRIGDFFAGTVVVRERTDEAPKFAEVFTSPVSDAAFRRVQNMTNFTADLSLLKDAEMEVVESFLRRRFDLPDQAREWMAWRVALPILYKLKPAYDLQTFTYEGFLEELLHRRQTAIRYLS
jgi:uncharacterized RDD family membrane protein YckC